MSKLRVINFRTMSKLLQRLGFEVVRQKGSHVFFKHPDGRTTTVPFHKGKDLPRPLIRTILHEIDLAPEHYEDELDQI